MYWACFGNCFYLKTGGWSKAFSEQGQQIFLSLFRRDYEIMSAFIIVSNMLWRHYGNTTRLIDYEVLMAASCKTITMACIVPHVYRCITMYIFISWSSRIVLEVLSNGFLFRKWRHNSSESATELDNNINGKDYKINQ